MSAMTVRKLDAHLTWVRFARDTEDVGPAVEEYADALHKAPYLVRVGHVLHVLARVVTGRWWA